MIRLQLAGQREAAATAHRFPREFSGGQQPLLHQIRTADELRAGRHLVVNTHNTGTGKTRAALLHLCELTRRPSEYSHVLFIAPTNELIAQHSHDAEEFVRRNGLDVQVYRLTAPDLRAVAGAADTPEHLTHPTAYLRHVLEAPGRTLVVTNPDIFYYALFFRYSRLHQRAMFTAMLSRFSYIIIDEFHYYNPKQLISFLFYLALSKQWGYFADGRQVALLTATPSSQVRAYLERLELDVAFVAPGAAQIGPAAQTAVLAPLDLHLVSAENRQGLLSLVEEEEDEIQRRMREGEQGAGISSALWRVNQAYARLRATPVGARVARLTGPEDRATRSAATAHDLILATPTVDIGYNFERQAKSRQSIDFLLCDARSADELIQRLGRAGRVLGKAVAGRPSTAWAAVPPELLKVLEPHVENLWERADFNAAVSSSMPPRFAPASYCYLDRGGVLEWFLSIFHVSRMMAREDEDRLRAIFEQIRMVLAPGSKVTYDFLQQQTRRFLKEEELFHGFPQEHELRGKLSGEKAEKARTAERLFRQETGLSSGPEFLRWLERRHGRYAVARARFSFRDSFDPPAALLYDPEHHLSSRDLVSYDVLHVIQHYAATWFREYADWRQALPPAMGAPTAQADDVAFCVLTGMRAADERVRLRFRLHRGDMTRSEWEELHCYRETAIRDLELEGDGVPLPREVTTVFRARYIPLYAARVDTVVASRLKGLCATEGWIGRDLEVTFRDGASQPYLMVMGTQMFFAAERLRPAALGQLRREGQQEPAWII